MSNADDGDEAFIGSYDWTEISPTAAIVEAVASVDGSPQTALDPLYGTIDPDALTELVDGNDNSGDIEISFLFESYRVTVCGDGTVIVVSPD